MNKNNNLPNRVVTLGYSTIFITVSQFLLLKISPLVFNFFNFFPLLLIGLILDLRLTLISFSISSIFIYLIFSSVIDSTNLNLAYILSNILLTFLLAFIFIFLIKKKKAWGKILSFYTIFSSTIMVSIFLFIFSEEVILIFEQIKDQYKLLFLKQESLNKSEIDSFFGIIQKIFPSINYVFHFVTVLINFYLSTIVIKKFRFHSSLNINYKEFEIDNWILYVFSLLVLISLFFSGDLNLLAVNLSICVAFIFFLKGYNIFYAFIDKLNQTKVIKNLVIFLLFIFLGYFLIFSLFFVGVIDKLKKILNR